MEIADMHGSLSLVHSPSWLTWSDAGGHLRLSLHLSNKQANFCNGLLWPQRKNYLGYYRLLVVANAWDRVCNNMISLQHIKQS